MAESSKRKISVPDRLQAWKEGEKHEPYSIRNKKMKEKKVKEKSKNYQASYREKRKGLDCKKTKPSPDEKEMRKAEARQRSKEYQKQYRQAQKEKKELKKNKDKKYQAQ